MDNTAEINDCTFYKTLNISFTIRIPKSASTVKWPSPKVRNAKAEQGR